MNWLDTHIIKNAEGYFKGTDDSLWVEIGNDLFRLAKGVGGSEGISPISKDEFIKRLIGR